MLGHVFNFFEIIYLTFESICIPGNFWFYFEGTVSWPAVVPAFVTISPVTSSQLYLAR